MTPIVNEDRGAVCLILCAQVLMLGITAGDQMTVYRDAINATIGSSVLLPVTFTLTLQFSKYTVEWEAENKSILYHMVRNCTVDPRGLPIGFSGEEFVVYSLFTDKVEFYKTNSSLLLYNIQVNDSGTYRVRFSSALQTSTQNITLWVLTEPLPGSAEASTWKPWVFAFRTVLCFFPLAALLIVLHGHFL